MNWITVEINPEWVTQSENFALNVNGTTNYSDSGQPRSNQTRKNHSDGKLAEFAASAAYTGSAPDCAIYKGKAKSWEADLTVDGRPVAVKSQTLDSFNKYGPSLTFQYGSRRKDAIFKSKENQVVYCLILPEKILVSPIFKLTQLSWGDPKLKYLVGEKIVAYLDQSHPELIEQAKNLI